MVLLCGLSCLDVVMERFFGVEGLGEMDGMSRSVFYALTTSVGHGRGLAIVNAGSVLGFPCAVWY